MATTTDFTTTPRRSSYLTGCMSLLCVPTHEEYRLVRNDKRGRDQKRTRWIKHEQVRKAELALTVVACAAVLLAEIVSRYNYTNDNLRVTGHGIVLTAAI
ncbi:hypothetical protein Tco_0098707 [Tanacetum coccineum]